MTRASPLDEAERKVEPNPPSEADADARAPIDRRLSDSNQAWLGKIVDGRYRVLEVVGRGGMGVVYRVEHLRMGKVAAMKVLHRDLVGDAEVVQRFEREAAAISKLHHPHTVQVFDFGTAGAALYLIMEYVRGLDLAHVISRDGPMPWARAAPLFVQICGALQEAHELGIVHRDLKPENVLITRTSSGRDYAKVLDFGLAKLDQRQVPSTETDKQQIVGTPYFMSPEQIRGDDVDLRTDIYSLGALMFEVLTGEHLFAGTTTVGVLTKHLTAAPDAPSARAPNRDIDPRVDAICKKALAKDPSERWRTAAELGEAIEEAYADTVEATGPVARSSRRLLRPAISVPEEPTDRSDHRLRRADIDAFERGLKRQKVVVMLGAALVVLGAAGAVVWYLQRVPPPLREEREPNDDVASANEVATGVPITGYLGKRHSLTDGDRDTFIVPWPTSSRHIVSVSVTGVPNIDLSLTASDVDGHNVTGNETAVGGGEAIHRRGIDGALVITVAEVLAADQKPIENVSDPYTLTITEEDPDAGEVEPNGTEANATPLSANHLLRGYLDTRDDVDLLKWTGSDGHFAIVIRADGLPLEWRTSDGKLRTPGAAEVDLHHGEIIRLDRTDRAGTGPLAGRDVSWSVSVSPK